MSRDPKRTRHRGRMFQASVEKTPTKTAKSKAKTAAKKNVTNVKKLSEDDEIHASTDKENASSVRAASRGVCVVVDALKSRVQNLKMEAKAAHRPKQAPPPAVVKPIKTIVKEETVTRKNEEGKDVKVVRRTETLPLERYVKIDDDLFMVETLDDSVVFLGDDDCCIMTPPVVEFPFLELE